MNYLVAVQRIQALQQRVAELSHQLNTEALKLVLLDQLVEVDVEQLKRDAHVITKCERVEHVDDIHAVVLIFLS